MPNQADIDRAKQGKDVWNAWAAENPGARVDFSGAILKGILFAGFRFPGKSDFIGSEFRDWTNFSGSVFSDVTDFTGAIFDKVNFAGARFSHFGQFTGAKFSHLAEFRGSIFAYGAFFDGATFPAGADFSSAIFSHGAYFIGATFSDSADFSKSEFLDLAFFPGGSFSVWTDFKQAVFKDYVDFSNREFNGSVRFHEAYFHQVPIFYGASIHQGVEFGNIDRTFTNFHSNEAEQRYRTLKLAMGQQQARTEEAAFAALELKSRRHRLMQEAKTRPFWKRIPLWSECLGYWLWEKCSDSGRSFFRPLRLYLLSGVAFASFYVLLCQNWFGDWWTSLRHGFRYAFLKQFPFAAAFRGGSDRIGELEERLFGSGLPPGWVDILNAAQSITALALIFLMGLGIRHKFRLR